MQQRYTTTTTRTTRKLLEPLEPPTKPAYETPIPPRPVARHDPGSIQSSPPPHPLFPALPFPFPLPPFPLSLPWRLLTLIPLSHTGPWACHWARGQWADGTVDTTGHRRSARHGLGWELPWALRPTTLAGPLRYVPGTVVPSYLVVLARCRVRRVGWIGFIGGPDRMMKVSLSAACCVGLTRPDRVIPATTLPVSLVLFTAVP